MPGVPSWDDISIHSLRMEGDLYRSSHHRVDRCISIHSLRMEGDLAIFQIVPVIHNISIHSLRMEGDEIGKWVKKSWEISIHSLRMEGDTVIAFYFGTQTDFNPLPPHGGRHSTDPPTPISLEISIHSLRMEGDDLPCFSSGQTVYFNPLPPHGGRQSATNTFYLLFAFQSTPSAWRETQLANTIVQITIFQSTPSAWRETRCRRFQPGFRKYFNPLPPHGGRRRSRRIGIATKSFQSTPSAWRETAKLHRKAFFISPILVQSCKKGCKRLHSAPEKMVFFEKREKNLVRNLQHLSVRL